MGILDFDKLTRKERMRILKRKKVYIKSKKLKMRAEESTFKYTYKNYKWKNEI